MADPQLTPQQQRMLKNQGIGPQSPVAAREAKDPKATAPPSNSAIENFASLLGLGNTLPHPQDVPATTSGAPGVNPATFQGPAGAHTDTLNPLAVQSFYAQTVAPLLHQIMGDSSAASDIQSMSAADKTAQYLPKEMQAFFAAQPGRIAGQQKSVDEALAASQLNAPAIQDLQNQMGSIKAQQLRNYAKILLEGGDPTAGLTAP